MKQKLLCNQDILQDIHPPTHTPSPPNTHTTDIHPSPQKDGPFGGLPLPKRCGTQKVFGTSVMWHL